MWELYSMRGAFLQQSWKGEKVFYHSVSVQSLGSVRLCNGDEIKICTNGTSTRQQNNNSVTLLCPLSASPSDDLSERRSSNSSLTSVTSRGSIMSPPEFNGGAGGTSAANLTSKMVSLKGRLSGVFNYWTGREKSPTQEKPCELKVQFVDLSLIYSCYHLQYYYYFYHYH